MVFFAPFAPLREIFVPQHVIDPYTISQIPCVLRPTRGISRRRMLLFGSTPNSTLERNAAEVTFIRLGRPQ